MRLFVFGEFWAVSVLGFYPFGLPLLTLRARFPLEELAFIKIWNVVLCGTMLYSAKWSFSYVT
ncbi:MAG: hypothetical protein A2W74_02635 [Planctomycetes bacterium RIFCSPLOWO2_12_38_17]|nr:MAG: hypothetical protein A2W74_02635 [Planctomycetes bacterium RIFCSPLOWO2_12_38_17]